MELPREPAVLVAQLRLAASEATAAEHVGDCVSSSHPVDVGEQQRRGDAARLPRLYGQHRVRRRLLARVLRTHAYGIGWRSSIRNEGRAPLSGMTWRCSATRLKAAQTWRAVISTRPRRSRLS